ncbi:hypothetical protein [Enterococcus sp. BWR-S5]|uniref:hypothetical protein n=1 Tax=Enterococcus sp. BWR-S5 TaxID=2787714 RepID=UPI001924D4AB|nr:hypothetical protein [Enterococcus sp. BWR-S5]MBL1224813.1 hypothetical protein [Enterococcus sp. BWR-S5]
MQTSYYPDQIKNYTAEEQFQKHREALNAIENYYNERGMTTGYHDLRQKMASERNLLEKHYRRFKNRKRSACNE